MQLSDGCENYMLINNVPKQAHRSYTWLSKSTMTCVNFLSADSPVIHKKCKNENLVDKATSRSGMLSKTHVISRYTFVSTLFVLLSRLSIVGL